MDSTMIHRTTALLRDAISGEYSSAARIVDGLLDLRLLAAETPALVELIDSILADVPGRFVATNDWWGDQLDRLDYLALTEDSDRPMVASTSL